MTHGQEHPPDLHRGFRWSPGVACYRSSKLVILATNEVRAIASMKPGEGRPRTPVAGAAGTDHCALDHASSRELSRAHLIPGYSCRDQLIPFTRIWSYRSGRMYAYRHESTRFLAEHSA